MVVRITQGDMAQAKLNKHDFVVKNVDYVNQGKQKYIPLKPFIRI